MNLTTPITQTNPQIRTERRILHRADSTYHHIRVVEEGSVRLLCFGGGQAQEQSAIDLEDPDRHVFDYSLLSMHSLRFCPNPSKILIVGLGGGVAPRSYQKTCPDAIIDVIELDPVVCDIARDFFFFKDNENTNVIVADGFDYLRDTEERYDIIILDAFFTNYIPLHLMSVEFLGYIKKCLSEKGVAAFNVCSVRHEHPHHLSGIVRTFGENIYSMTGPLNPLSLMLYCLNDSSMKLEDFELPEACIPEMLPQKMKIDNYVKSLEPISIMGIGKNAV